MGDTTATVARTIRIDPELWRQVRVQAATEGRSANAWVNDALRLVLMTAVREGK